MMREKSKGSSNLKYYTAKLTAVLLVLVWIFRSNYGLPAISRAPASSVPPFQTPSSSNGNNITIVDFFKPYDPAYPTSAPTNRYFKKINLRPLSPYNIPRVNFTEWIDEQFRISFERLLANIGDENLLSYEPLKNDGVLEGVVIASPSKKDPNYFYQWARDSAITLNTVVSNLFDDRSSSSQQPEVNVTLAGTVLKYLNNSYDLQRLNNPSGQGVPSESLKGVGEPKWHVDNQPFSEPWGRPQNDGPPLRCLTTLHFLKQLQNHQISLEAVVSAYESFYNKPLDLIFENERELFEKILIWDLKFVIENWKENSFDLWEEIQGQHFFTSIVQLTSVKFGILYLKEHKKEWPDLQSFVADLEDCFDNIHSFIFMEGGFINPNKNFIVETPSMLHSRSGLDIAVIIGTLLTHDTQMAKSDTIPFDVDDSGILNTLYSMVKSMEIIYPINHQRANLKIGVALGRYPEDVYDGVQTSEGNPWFLATAYASELLYKLIWKNYQLEDDLVIPLNNWESEFWTLIFEGFEEYMSENSFGGSIYGESNNYQLVIPYNSPAFNQTMISIFDLGESFLDKIREHVSDDGNMSEQFNKYTGYLQGAENLTWSYGAFWSSCHIRSKVLQLLQ